jgi:hypothetical protein
MTSYLVKFPVGGAGQDEEDVLDSLDALAEMIAKKHLLHWFSDENSDFYRSIVETCEDNREDKLVDKLRKAGWNVEPAPAGIYQNRDEPDDIYACRVDNDGGKVSRLRLAP